MKEARNCARQPLTFSLAKKTALCKAICEFEMNVPLASTVQQKWLEILSKWKPGFKRQILKEPDHGRFLFCFAFVFFVFIIISIFVPKDKTKFKWFISRCARG